MLIYIFKFSALRKSIFSIIDKVINLKVLSFKKNGYVMGMLTLKTMRHRGTGLVLGIQSGGLI